MNLKRWEMRCQDFWIIATRVFKKGIASYDNLCHQHLGDSWILHQGPQFGVESLMDTSISHKQNSRIVCLTGSFLRWLYNYNLYPYIFLPLPIIQFFLSYPKAHFTQARAKSKAAVNSFGSRMPSGVCSAIFLNSLVNLPGSQRLAVGDSWIFLTCYF